MPYKSFTLVFGMLKYRTEVIFVRYIFIVFICWENYVDYYCMIGFTSYYLYCM